MDTVQIVLGLLLLLLVGGVAYYLLQHGSQPLPPIPTTRRQADLGRQSDIQRDRHLNGRVVRDQSGTSLRDESEACAYEVGRTPLTLRKSVSPRRNTYLALVSDGQRTLCVVRGIVVIEKH
jgi:hypothetical protein